MSTELTSASVGTLTVADRSKSITDALRQMARVSRFKDGRRSARGVPALRAQRRSFVTPLLFLLCFVVPLAVGSTYVGLIASDRYVTEGRFAIRPAIASTDKAAKDEVGATTGVPQAMVTQDTIIVTEYILSRPLVEEIERRYPIREWFSSPDVDYFSRFDAKKPIEKLVKYWASRVDVSVSAHAGIVTVNVNAFTPEQSLALTKTIVELSERLVNDLTTRARNTALDESQRELARAEERLTKVRLAVRDLRNREGLLDARKTAEANLKVTSELRLQRIQLAVRRALLARDLAPEARSIQELDLQMKHLDETIAKVEATTTTQNPEERRALSSALTNFESMEIERKNAESFYGQMITASERARIIADRQIEFFNTVVEPTLADSAQAPRRGLIILLIAIASAALFCLALVVKSFATR